MGRQAKHTTTSRNCPVVQLYLLMGSGDKTSSV